MDPITFEIIRHRMFRIIQEAIITLKHVTGSAITNEGHDLMVSLYRANGDLLLGGVGFLHHLIPAAEAVRVILRQFDGDIHQGDMFLTNCPYTAAMHTSDVFMITPIHYDGELVAWSACFVHVYDIGAVNEGGFSPDATSVFMEGFSTPGIKVLERGEIRRDARQTLLNMVRVPEMVALDISSLIAAGNVARDRMVTLLDKYGAETLDEIGQTLIDQSEQLLRERLRELPDGRWEARQYIDVHDEVYRINLAMTKRGDRLTYDFTGSSPQSETYGINCSYWAVLGALFAPLFPLLAYDLTWNEGLLRPVEMIAPEGTVINATRPAPTSCATVCGVQSVNNASTTVLSKMLLASEKHAQQATGVWHGTLHALFLFGINQEGLETIGFQTEAFSGSGGARTFADGVDLGGELVNPICRMANVETTEGTFAVRYLFRRRMRDSGGAGRFRGGAGGEYALVAHDAPKSMNYNVSSKGVLFPLAEGLGGGYPGAPANFFLIRDEAEPSAEQPTGSNGANTSDQPALVRSNVDRQFAQRIEDIGGPRESTGWGLFPLRGEDVLYVRWSGGGGVGDPLLREPERVLTDYRTGIVSLGAARDVYGVVIAEEADNVDVAATDGHRAELRKERMDRARPISQAAE